MFKVEFPDFGAQVDEVETEIATGVTAEVAGGTYWLQGDLRDQAVYSGLGQKIANTWRAKIYPNRGVSLDPAGYIWSKAPKIADAFDRNPVIVPIMGGRYLAIPTDNVPRRGRYNRRMTPREVEKDYRQKLIFRRSRKGRLLGFVQVAEANTAKGFSTAKTKLASSKIKKRLILMFVFVKSVRPGKRIDIDSAVNHASDMIVKGINQRFA